MGVGGAADNKENAHSQGEQDCPYPVLNANTASGEAGGEGESEEEGKNGDGLDEEDGGEAEGGGLQEVADNAHSGPGPPFSGGDVALTLLSPSSGRGCSAATRWRITVPIATTSADKSASAAAIS